MSDGVPPNRSRVAGAEGRDAIVVHCKIADAIEAGRGIADARVGIAACGRAPTLTLSSPRKASLFWIISWHSWAGIAWTQNSDPQYQWVAK
jgi:hypothetical protein